MSIKVIEQSKKQLLSFKDFNLIDAYKLLIKQKTDFPQ